MLFGLTMLRAHLRKKHTKYDWYVFFIHSCNDMKQGTDTVHQDRKEIRTF